MIMLVVAEYEVMGIAAKTYLNLVDEQVARIVIATLNIICVLMDTLKIAIIVAKPQLFFLL